MNPTQHRLFHTLILVGTSAAACGGAATPNGSGGADGGDASGGPASGGDSGTATGGTAGDANGDGEPNVPIDYLPCPPEQWTCDFSPCRGWPTDADHCECDPSAPLTADDCNADEDFTCAESNSDYRGVPLDGATLWSCRCEPRLEADDCCSDERWHDSGYFPEASGCTDEPGQREVVCSCLVLLR